MYDEKLTILFLAANPVNTTQLRLEEELRDVQDALQRSDQRSRFVLRSAWAVRNDDLRRAMLNFEPQIVHFAGHGDEGGIYLEDRSGNARPVPGEALGNFFAQFPSVQCVVLNACYSEEVARAINRSVPYVLGMRTVVQDRAAITFAVAFYDGLGGGQSFDMAFNLAVSALQMEGLMETATPVMHRGSNAEEQNVKSIQSYTSESLPSMSYTIPQITRLSGPQYKALHSAMLGAYNQESLEMMARYELGVPLQNVAGGSDFSAVVFNLIDWAQRSGRLTNLLEAAAHSDNQDLKATVATLPQAR
jgi:hypothetical protein